MKNPRDQDIAFMAVVDRVALDNERANAFAELRPEAAHPGLFDQPFEAVNYRVDESIRGGGAGVLGDVGLDLLEVLLGKGGQPIGHLRLFGASRTTARLDPFGKLPA
jgi:hypothetical protein